jgi:Low molecular weight phosphotyrosine protein phosphatase
VTEASIDQGLALRTAAAKLAEEFEGVYGAETIERFLISSYDQFASKSTVANFLPLLAERFARQRLTAQARIEGLRHDGRPVILFLCVHNAGRSQMALGLLQHLAGGRAVGWSGGSDPGMEINEAAVAAMAEKGIDITGEYPSPGRTRWFRPRTLSSPWAAATRARSFRANATKTGRWTTRRARAWRTSGRSVTRLNAACDNFFWSSRSRSPGRRAVGTTRTGGDRRCGCSSSAEVTPRLARVYAPGSWHPTLM